MELNKEQYLAELKRRAAENPEVKFEFQEVGIELEKHFGKENKKRIWPIFHTAGMTEDKVRRALVEFEKRKLNYFMWILNKVIK